MSPHRTARPRARRTALALAAAAWLAPLPAEAVANATVDEDARFAVAVVNGRFDTHCSGSLIAPNLLLTARHCVDSSAPHPRCGLPVTLTSADKDLHVSSCTNMHDASCSWTQSIKVLRPSTDELCGSDIAAVVLREALVGATLAVPDFSVPRVDERPSFSVAAYGAVNPLKYDWGIRRRADALVLSCVGAQCGPAGFGGPISPAEFATQSGGLCDGDSGGPAFIAGKDSEPPRLIGVVSRGGVARERCQGGLFTRLGAWRGLINAAMLEAAKQSGEAPPLWALESVNDECLATGTCAPAEQDRVDRGAVCAFGPPSRAPYAWAALATAASTLAALIERRRRNAV